jgi:hypothetical protein
MAASNDYMLSGQVDAIHNLVSCRKGGKAGADRMLPVRHLGILCV